MSGVISSCSSFFFDILSRKFLEASQGMTTHSGSLVWKIPWTEEPGKLQSMDLQRVRPN